MHSQISSVKSLSFSEAQPTGADKQNPTANASSSALSQQNGGQDINTWLGQARSWMSWYQGIVSGEIKLQPGEKAPTQADYSQMQQWYQWATQSSSSGSNWDPNSGAGSIPGPTQGMPLPQGAKQGPMGNVVFNTEKAETNYSPSAMPIDVLSDQFTLNVDVKVKNVTTEKTTDSRLNPPTEVIKITVKDPSSVPSETVYFVQPEAKIKINTIGGKGVTQNGTDTLKLTDGSAQISVGSYQASANSSDASGPAESSMPGVEDPLTPGTFTYKPEFETGDKIDFFSKPGMNQTHLVFSDANITAKPGDSANATLGANGDLTIKVTHTDTPATSDTYVIKAGYNATLNINKEYITFDGKKVTDDKVPTSFGIRLKVPTLTGTASAPPPPPPVGIGNLYLDNYINSSITRATKAFDDLL